MNTTDFSLLFPEVDNPSKLLNNLVGIAHSRNLPEHEFYSVLHDLSLKRINYTGYTQNPDGYIIKSFKNACTDYFKEEGKTTSLNENQIVEDVIEPNIDTIKLIEKLAEVDSKIDSYKLSPQEYCVYKILKEVCENKHPTMVKYFKEVRKKAVLENVPYGNVGKIIERIREKLKGAMDMSDGMMGFIQIQNPEIVYFLNSLINLDESYDKSDIEEFVIEITSKFKHPLPQELFSDIVLVMGIYLSRIDLLKETYQISEIEKFKFEYTVDTIDSILESNPTEDVTDSNNLRNYSVLLQLAACLLYILLKKNDEDVEKPTNPIFQILEDLMPTKND